ncbi:MAG: hypothetical protein RIT24_1775 [Planctomycetota bacterium]
MSTTPERPTDVREHALSRRTTLANAILPGALLLLGGCAGGVRRDAPGISARRDSPGIPARRGASVVRADGTRCFRNHRLVDQDGHIVRFQDDLVEGRAFAATFQYAKCNGICRNMTEKMRAASELLGDAMDHPIQFYMFSLAEDSPADMRAYMQAHGLYGKPGWRFLSGSREAITDIRWAFGFGEPDEDLDQNLAAHTGMVRYCHHPTDKWAACPALGDPRSIALLMLRCFPCDERPRVGALESAFAQGGTPMPGYKAQPPVPPRGDA